MLIYSTLRLENTSWKISFCYLVDHKKPFTFRKLRGIPAVHTPSNMRLLDDDDTSTSESVPPWVDEVNGVRISADEAFDKMESEMDLKCACPSLKLLYY